MPTPRRWPLVALLCLIAPAAACFGPLLARGRQFGYRDAGFFYYPFYQRIQQQWADGHLPLWEPAENAGMPLLGNPTAAVFYPGKLLFVALPYPDAFRWYTIAHVGLAFGAMLVLCRRLGRSPTAATLAAIAYAYGGQVLFQHSNVVFLVGAAWMPLGFAAADAWLREGHRRAVGGLAGVLALQFLGGDPEAAYLTILAALAYAVGLAVARDGRPRWLRLPFVAPAALIAYAALLALTAADAAARREAAVRRPDEPAGWQIGASTWAALAWAAAGLVIARRWWRGDGGDLRRSTLGLIAAGAIAAAITGVHLAPALEFGRLSTRSSIAGIHDPYLSAVHPYRVAEFLWPNVYGRLDAGNHHWLKTLPPAYDESVDGQWTASLYLGGLTLALAVAGFGFRGGPSWRAWMTGLAVVAAIGSLNELASPVYWARELPGLAELLGPHDPPGAFVRVDGGLRDADGGPYWLLATALPGFGTFRHPGKLMTLTCLAVAVLAGAGWDRLADPRSRRRASRWLFVALALSLLLVLASWPAGPAIISNFERRAGAAMSVFGPLRPAAALGDLRRALLHGAIVAAGSLVAVRLSSRRPRLAAGLALAITAADLAAANASLVWTVPQSVYDDEPMVAALIAEAERSEPSPGPFRVHRSPVWAPDAWARTGGAPTLAESVRWRRDTIEPKYAITSGLDYTFTMGTTELLGYALYFTPRSPRLSPETARALRVAPGSTVLYQPRRAFDLWTTRYFVLPARLVMDDVDRGFASLLPRTETLYPDLDAFDGPGGDARRRRWLHEQDVRVLRNRAAFPRAWVVHEARFLRPIAGDDPADRRSVLERLLYQDDEIWTVPGRPVLDPSRTAIVESADPAPIARALPGGPPSTAETVAVEPVSPREVRLTARLDRPGLVVLADVHYPGWRLSIDGEPAPILRVNRLMRGAFVGAGTHVLTYSYEPITWPIGLAATATGLIALALVLALPSPGGRGPG